MILTWQSSQLQQWALSTISKLSSKANTMNKVEQTIKKNVERQSIIKQDLNIIQILRGISESLASKKQE